MESLRDTNDESLEEFVKKLPNSWRDKGLREGKKEGIEQGIEQGKKQGKKEIAKKMLAKGMEKEYIIEITGLTKKEIDELSQS